MAGLDPAGKYLLEASIFRGLSDEHIAGVLLTSAPDVEKRREAAFGRLSRKSRARLKRLQRPNEAGATGSRRTGLGSGSLPSKLLWSLAAAVIACLVGLLVNVHAVLACVMVATLLAAVLVGIRPALAVAAIPLLIFFEADLPSIVAALVLLIALVLLGFGRARLRPRAPLAWAAAFALWGFASAVWTVNLSASNDQFLGLAFSLCIAVSLATLINSDADLRLFVYAFLSTSVATGIVAIATVATGAASRADGFVGDPNIFAVYQLVALPLAFLLAADASRPWVRRCAYLAMLVSVTAIFASLSRGGLIALGVVALLLLLAPVSRLYRSAGQKVAVWSFVLVAATVGLLVFSGGLSDRISEKDVAAGSGRVNEWRAGMSAFESNPVVGLGLGGFYVDSNELLRTTQAWNCANSVSRKQGTECITPISSQLQTLASSASCCSRASSSRRSSRC